MPMKTRNPLPKKKWIVSLAYLIYGRTPHCPPEISNGHHIFLSPFPRCPHVISSGLPISHLRPHLQAVSSGLPISHSPSRRWTPSTSLALQPSPFHHYQPGSSHHTSLCLCPHCLPVDSSHHTGLSLFPRCPPMASRSRHTILSSTLLSLAISGRMATLTPKVSEPEKWGYSVDRKNVLVHFLGPNKFWIYFSKRDRCRFYEKSRVKKA